MSKRDERNMWAFLQGIVFVSELAYLIGDREYMENMLLRFQGYCPWCRYKYDHPIVKHTQTYGECGWR